MCRLGRAFISTGRRAENAGRLCGGVVLVESEVKKKRGVEPRRMVCPWPKSQPSSRGALLLFEERPAAEEDVR